METGLVTENKDLLLVRKTWSKFLVGQRELDLTDIQLSAHVVECLIWNLAQEKLLQSSSSSEMIHDVTVKFVASSITDLSTVILLIQFLTLMRTNELQFLFDDFSCDIGAFTLLPLIRLIPSIKHVSFVSWKDEGDSVRFGHALRLFLGRDNNRYQRDRCGTVESITFFACHFTDVVFLDFLEGLRERSVTGLYMKACNLNDWHMDALAIALDKSTIKDSIEHLSLSGNDFTFHSLETLSRILYQCCFLWELDVANCPELLPSLVLGGHEDVAEHSVTFKESFTNALCIHPSLYSLNLDYSGSGMTLKETILQPVMKGNTYLAELSMASIEPIVLTSSSLPSGHTSTLTSLSANFDLHSTETQEYLWSNTILTNIDLSLPVEGGEQDDVITEPQAEFLRRICNRNVTLQKLRKFSVLSSRQTSLKASDSHKEDSSLNPTLWPSLIHQVSMSSPEDATCLFLFLQHEMSQAAMMGGTKKRRRICIG